jgi:undecaprenyl-diphosphatase
MVVTRASWSRRKSSRGLWVGAVLCAALFALVYAYCASAGFDKMTKVDEVVADSAAGTVNDRFTGFWKGLTTLGDTTTIIGATIVLVLVIAAVRGFRHAAWLLISTAAAYGLNTAIKHIVARERPDAMWGIEVDGYSFPSANAMLMLTLYLLFAIMIARSARIHPAIRTVVVAAAILLIAAMGWSRLYFSVHYATDIAAGFLAGGAIVCAAAALSKARTY